MYKNRGRRRSTKIRLTPDLPDYVWSEHGIPFPFPLTEQEVAPVHTGTRKDSLNGNRRVSIAGNRRLSVVENRRNSIHGGRRESIQSVSRRDSIQAKSRKESTSDGKGLLPSPTEKAGEPKSKLHAHTNQGNTSANQNGGQKQAPQKRVVLAQPGAGKPETSVEPAKESETPPKAETSTEASAAARRKQALPVSLRAQQKNKNLIAPKSVNSKQQKNGPAKSGILKNSQKTDLNHSRSARTSPDQPSKDKKTIESTAKPNSPKVSTGTVNINSSTDSGFAETDDKTDSKTDDKRDRSTAIARSNSTVSTTHGAKSARKSVVIVAPGDPEVDMHQPSSSSQNGGAGHAVKIEVQEADPHNCTTTATTSLPGYHTAVPITTLPYDRGVSVDKPPRYKRTLILTILSIFLCGNVILGPVGLFFLCKSNKDYMTGKPEKGMSKVDNAFRLVVMWVVATLIGYVIITLTMFG